MNEKKTKDAIRLFFRDGAALWYQALPDDVEMLAKKAGLNDAQTVFAAVNGLTPKLRQVVPTKEANLSASWLRPTKVPSILFHRRHQRMILDIQKKLTLMSVTMKELRQQQQRRSHSPAPLVHFDNYNGRSPAPETTCNHSSAFYGQPQQQIVNPQHDRRPSLNITSIFNRRSAPHYPVYNSRTSFQLAIQRVEYPQRPSLTNQPSASRQFLFNN